MTRKKSAEATGVAEAAPVVPTDDEQETAELAQEIDSSSDGSIAFSRVDAVTGTEPDEAPPKTDAPPEPLDEQDVDGEGVNVVGDISAKPPPGPPPPPATERRPRQYRVWPHGELHHDGVVYRPGAIVTLPDDVAEPIRFCLLPAD